MSEIPTSIAVRVRRYPSGYRCMPDVLLDALKPLPNTVGLAIPKSECVVCVKVLRDWLKLCDDTQYISLVLLPKRLGIQNGRAYAQFKHNIYLYRGKYARPTKVNGLIRLDLIQWRS